MIKYILIALGMLIIGYILLFFPTISLQVNV